MTDTPPVVHLKVVLEDVEPAVIRRLIVPLDLRMDRLHQVLQVALGWTNTHLWELRADETGWGVPDPDWGFDGPLDARKATLREVIEDTGARRLLYLYDFGDGWEHTITLERIGPGDPAAIYPMLVDASGRCPPEDVGGPFGYAEFLEAMADPAHERHGELCEWFDDTFDPHAIDIAEIQQELLRLGRKWIRRPRRKSAPPSL
ncbi:plasmid pRiA4b ORF-3 family protein [Microvirga sp. Mcv34]|uniref:plasmid pRiA4b ORF-3 family protein n=1 Tax=Microvirga sp. Mcv34 TaxID=2926016 RepID=UPI0021CA35F8|nr:plasmid pRiA4b ORF-3 family protein [Microvirga sp. Mcv34]